MPNITVSANTRTTFSNGNGTFQELINWLNSISSGQVVSDAVWYSRNDATALGATAYAGQAAGLFILGADAEDEVSADVAGVTVEVDAGSSPGAANSILTQSAWCTAVRALVTVNRKVTAVNRCATITCGSVLAGESAQVNGVGFTAAAGAPTEFGKFNISGDNTADALSLATAINRHYALAGIVRAVSVAAVVYVCPIEERAPIPGETVISFAATMVVANADYAVGAVGMVLAAVAGDIGNEVRLSDVAGTGATIATNGTADFLGSGTGGGTSNVHVYP